MDEPGFSAEQGNLPGSEKREQSVTSDWDVLLDPIEGVVLREVKNVIKPDGSYLTEVFRRDWGLDDLVVDQVFQNVLLPGGVSGWHAHRFTTDRIFVNLGTLKITLYDARTESKTFEQVNEFRLGERRPALLVIPPGVWHAVVNVGDTRSALLNLVDHAYTYDDPDHWGLPIDTPLIPHRIV